MQYPTPHCLGCFRLDKYPVYLVNINAIFYGFTVRLTLGEGDIGRLEDP